MASVTAVTEESQEDILLLSLRSLNSIFRTYRLVYLAESYAYYGLVSSTNPNPTSWEESKESEENILKSNLEKAYGLLEFADEVMSGDGMY